MNILKFQIKQSKRNRKWRSYAIGLNGEKVWWTEQYERKAKAEHACDLLDPEKVHTREILPAK